MAYGSTSIFAAVTGGNDGSWSVGPSGTTRNMTTAINAETIVSLSVGANTITVPTGATNAIIFPSSNTASTTNANYGGTLTLKGVAGDTGITISSASPTLLPFDTAPSTFVLNATASGTISIRFL
jgi:hypothetical protein